MATPPKPTILLVHGGWHIPASYSKLTRALKAASYEVHCPRLLSVNGARPPNSSLDTDTDIIRSYATSLVDAGRTVIAIMHSYGGQVGTNALHGLGLKARNEVGLEGGIAHLIYMAAYAPLENTTMLDKVREFGHGDLMNVIFNYADDGTVLHRDPSQLSLLLLGPDANEEEAKEYLATLVLWNGKVMDEPAGDKVAWREIPLTYVLCDQDSTVPYPYQQSFVETLKEEGASVETVELHTGHCPNLTATNDIVNVVKGVAAKI
ncbi:Alpha/beta hydrolase fold-1 [Lophiotrema nucula]|uniref:Alpha/beta hydrolase fold-1 n=1 Tax=Lophiotrema nucula TaxID=690887 RepID=A0A6A5Z089_9PLEO|nr:Alpha/beta hydrolase fold-1 [Lophiotrema nucula]